MDEASQAGRPGVGRIGQLTFIVLMLALTGLFITLGVWQVQRLAEKELQIAAVEARVGAAPIAFPPVADWPSLVPEDLEYHPVTLTGAFDHASTVLVFTNLIDPRGQYGRVGYWVMAPLAVEDGAGVVWINRGFVPERIAAEFATGGMAPEGVVTLDGLLRRPERANAFTPEPNLDERREWVRDPARLTSAFLPADAVPTAPLTVDLLAGAPGELPQAGETQLSFPNRHLEYAGTWFAFALVTPLMLCFWVWRQRKSSKLAENRKAN